MVAWSFGPGPCREASIRKSTLRYPWYPVRHKIKEARGPRYNTMGLSCDNPQAGICMGVYREEPIDCRGGPRRKTGSIGFSTFSTPATRRISCWWLCGRDGVVLRTCMYSTDRYRFSRKRSQGREKELRIGQGSFGVCSSASHPPPGAQSQDELFPCTWGSDGESLAFCFFSLLNVSFPLRCIRTLWYESLDVEGSASLHSPPSSERRVTTFV